MITVTFPDGAKRDFVAMCWFGQQTLIPELQTDLPGQIRIFIGIDHYRIQQTLATYQREQIRFFP